MYFNSQVTCLNGYSPNASHFRSPVFKNGDYNNNNNDNNILFVGPSGQKITRTDNTAKYAGPGVRQIVLFVYFVLHRKSEMQLVCQNDNGQLGIRFCFK